MNTAETGNSKSIWIVGLKFIAWLVFFAIIILGIVVAINADEEVGFLFFLASVPIAFFYCGRNNDLFRCCCGY